MVEHMAHFNLIYKFVKCLPSQDSYFDQRLGDLPLLLEDGHTHAKVTAAL